MKPNKLWAGLLALGLGAQVAAAGKADLFDATAVYTGLPSALNLTANIFPAAADLGASGNYYIAAIIGNQILLMTPEGWTPFDGVNVKGFPSSSLAPLGFPLLSGADISGAECAAVLAGYGRDASDLLNNGLFRIIYQVPAKIPRTTPLPCSAMVDSDVARFLQQATFGPTAADIAEVKRLGFSGWVESQFNTPRSGYGDWAYYPETQPVECRSDGVANSIATLCERDNYSLFPLQIRFFQNALSARDQLRQRVAFALSQFLVISANDGDLRKPYSFVPFQHMLMDEAFGNYETILTRMTLSPAMGNYLNMVNNGKPTGTQQANENYARELLQLFSIGLYKLNTDGTPQTDASGELIASYDEDVIKGFARTFTGWTYPPLPGVNNRTYNPPYYIGDMIAIANNHDTGTKLLLDGKVLPANQTPDKDLADAIRNVFLHPNVGPFVGKQLIQHLVTSNPSPAYVSRVASAFNNNGAGVRGDMKAVIRAILLDPEARGGMRSEAVYGSLREPALFLSHFYRALGGVSDGVWMRSVSSSLGQNIYYPETVFNYFPADNTLKTGEAAPEFGIHNTSTALARANAIYTAVYGGSSSGNLIFAAQPDAKVTNATGSYLDLTPYMDLAADPAALVDRLNILLMHGTMSPATRAALIQAVNGAGTNSKARAQMAIYLAANSSQFLVER